MNTIEVLEDQNGRATGQRFVLITLFAVILIDAMGVSLIYPILPSLFLKPDGLLGPTVGTATRDFWYAVSLSIFPVGMFLGMPVIGSLSDRFGRKKMMMLCLLGTVAGYLICMAGIGFTMKWIFFAGRFVSGICASSSAIAMAAIADISEGTEDEVGKMGWPMVAQLGGFIIGPLIAGFGVNGKVNSVSQFMIPFIIASVLAIANAVLLQFAFKETKCETGHRMSLLEGFKEFKFIFVDRRVRLLAFLYLFIQVGIQDFLQGVSLIMAQQFNYSSTQLSIFFAVTGAATAIAVIVVQPVIDRISAAGRLVDASEKKRRFASRLGIEPTTFWFCVFTGVILVLLSVASYEALYYVTAMFVGGLSTLIGMRFIAVFSSAVAPEEQGKVMGGVGAILALSIVIASNDIGELMRFSHNLLLLIAGVTVLIPTFFVRRPIRRALAAGEESEEAPACVGT